MNERQVIHLNGQRTFKITPDLGVHNFCCKVITGKIRVNHCCYDPDGGTWLSSPNGGRQAHYDISASNGETILSFSIENSYGKKDKIVIVNPSFFKDASFIFQPLDANDDTRDIINA